MYLIRRQRNETLSLPCKELTPQQLKSASSLLAQRILKRLADIPSYPKELARQLHVHEQKVYYHIRRLEKGGIIHIARAEMRQGASARYYALSQPSFSVRFREFQPTAQKASFANESSYLEPFVQDGELKALIVVGSPDPHGPEKARSRDGYYGMDLALFLGTFLNYIPGLNVRLDTEMRDEELKQNLIIIGGPIVNTVAGKVNDALPVRFTPKSIISMVSGEEYFSDEIGMIVKAESPFASASKILLVAGRRHAGTRACIIAFIRHFSEISAGNRHNGSVQAKVIEGVDLDSDGVVDEIELKE